MVAAHDLRLNVGFLEPQAQRLRDEKIINAPTDIAGTRAAHRAPPTVMSPALFKFAEGVHEPIVYKIGEAGALLNGKAVVTDVGLRICEVNLGVRQKITGFFFSNFFR